MRRHFFTLCLCMIASLSSMAQNLRGTWNGELETGAMKLPIVIHLDTDSQGQTVCTMDSPNQGAKGIATEIVFLSADSLNIRIPAIGVSYAGKLADGKLCGTFRQSGMSLPLNLSPGEVRRERPQTPRPPFSYKTEEVVFTNETDGARLAGTLTYPADSHVGKTKVPVVLMVTGSGLQNRDEEIFDHKPFAVIADHLARNGIASLRYDDRGFGQSTGEVKNATTEDLMRDALAGLAFLRKNKQFGKVGILGHSEGGIIAFMAASRHATDFVVSMAGTALRGDSVSTEQNNNALRRAGQPATMTVAQYRELIKNQLSNAWLKFFVNFDPAHDISMTRCPVMALNGSKDMQVSAESNLGTIRRILPPNKKNLIKEYPGLNHLFQHCATGFVDEYATIEETISPEVLDDISTWINSIF